MIIWLTLESGKRIDLTLPFPGAKYVVGQPSTCCIEEETAVYSREKVIDSHDTYAGTALCARCHKPVGKLRVRVSTIFGIEEDEEVLNGRCRVY